ncbi:MAG: preprotein translocase subunit YajC, partial [Akkermansiaceae bacterium]|nr:preprotein translocase subunit YajC [Akkermansiaceae bacterium]
TVHHISDKTVTIKLAEGVFVPFEKSSIQSVHKVRSGSRKEEEKEGQDADRKE